MIPDSFFSSFHSSALLYYCVARHICSVSVLLCLGNIVSIFSIYVVMSKRGRPINLSAALYCKIESVVNKNGAALKHKTQILGHVKVDFTLPNNFSRIPNKF